MKPYTATALALIGLASVGLSISSCGEANRSGSLNRTTVEPAGYAGQVTPETTTQPTTSPTLGRASSTPTPTTEEQVRSILAPYLKKYSSVLEALGSELDIQNAITEACKAKANGFQVSDEEMGAVAMFVGAQLQAMGSDVATFMHDSTEANRKVADIAGC